MRTNLRRYCTLVALTGIWRGMNPPLLGLPEPLTCGNVVEPVTGIEPACPAWESHAVTQAWAKSCSRTSPWLPFTARPTPTLVVRQWSGRVGAWCTPGPHPRRVDRVRHADGPRRPARPPSRHGSFRSSDRGESAGQTPISSVACGISCNISASPQRQELRRCVKT